MKYVSMVYEYGSAPEIKALGFPLPLSVSFARAFANELLEAAAIAAGEKIEESV